MVSGGINVAFQMAANGGDISKINGAELAGAIVGGAIAGAITSGGSAVASITTGIAAKAIVVATGTVAGAIGNVTGTVTQNVLDGDTNTKPMDGVGPSMVRGGVTGTIGGAYNVARGNIPDISYKAPSYVTDKIQSSAANARTMAVSVTRAIGEGIRDLTIDKALEKIMVLNE